MSLSGVKFEKNIIYWTQQFSLWFHLFLPLRSFFPSHSTVSTPSWQHLSYPKMTFERWIAFFSVSLSLLHQREHLLHQIHRLRKERYQKNQTTLLTLSKLSPSNQMHQKRRRQTRVNPNAERSDGRWSFDSDEQCCPKIICADRSLPLSHRPIFLHRQIILDLQTVSSWSTSGHCPHNPLQECGWVFAFPHLSKRKFFCSFQQSHCMNRVCSHIWRDHRAASREGSNNKHAPLSTRPACPPPISRETS